MNEKNILTGPSFEVKKNPAKFVFLLHGYGDNGEGYFRISITTSEERLKEAVKRLSKQHIHSWGVVITICFVISWVVVFTIVTSMFMVVTKYPVIFVGCCNREKMSHGPYTDRLLTSIFCIIKLLLTLALPVAVVVPIGPTIWNGSNDWTNSTIATSRIGLIISNIWSIAL